jgi:hypothetical protein
MVPLKSLTSPIMSCFVLMEFAAGAAASIGENTYSREVSRESTALG